MGEEANVVGEVKIFQLFCECPLDACVVILGCLLHDPVDNQKEDQWREQAALLHSSLYGKGVRELAIVNHLACGIFIQLLDDVDEWWDTVVMHQLPYDFSVHTVEGFLKVDKGHVEGGLPFDRLFNGDA